MTEIPAHLLHRAAARRQKSERDATLTHTVLPESSSSEESYSLILTLPEGKTITISCFARTRQEVLDMAEHLKSGRFSVVLKATSTIEEPL